MPIWNNPPKPSRRYGWCRYHRLWLTLKQPKKARCLEKECKHFEGNANHEIWRQKDRRGTCDLDNL